MTVVLDALKLEVLLPENLKIHDEGYLTPPDF